MRVALAETKRVALAVTPVLARGFGPRRGQSATAPANDLDRICAHARLTHAASHLGEQKDCSASGTSGDSGV
jgi:hypothetical protein